MDEFLDDPLAETVDKDASASVEPQVTSEPKDSRFEADNIVVSVDAEAFDAGFEAPFDVTIKAVKEVKKGDLIKAVVAAWAAIPNGKTDPIGKAFKRWCQKTFNMSDAAFSSPDALKNELEPAEMTVLDLQKQGTAFEVIDAEAQVEESELQ